MVVEVIDEVQVRLGLWIECSTRGRLPARYGQHSTMTGAEHGMTYCGIWSTGVT